MGSVVSSPPLPLLPSLPQQLWDCSRGLVGNAEEAFGSFHYWRDPLPPVPGDESVHLTPEELCSLDKYFETRSYCVGYQISAADRALAAVLDDQEELSRASHPNLCRFARHAKSFEEGWSVSDDQLGGLVARLVQLGKVPPFPCDVSVVFACTLRCSIIWLKNFIFSVQYLIF